MDSILRGRDLLSLGDLTSNELLMILDAAEAQKRAWSRGARSAPLAGKSVADLVALFQSGQAYVNVGTTQNPKGEIRGQIR